MAQRQDIPDRIKLKGVVVVWSDHYSTSDWQPLVNAIESAEADALNVSMGWLLDESDDRVVLALTRSIEDDRVSDVLVVYKAAIRRMWKF